MCTEKRTRVWLVGGLEVRERVWSAALKWLLIPEKGF